MSGAEAVRVVLPRAILCLAVAACGLTGPSDNPKVSAFSGTALVVDKGIFAVDVEGAFQKAGPLRADLNWTVVAPGSGRFGGQPPDISLLLQRSNCAMCGAVGEAGPAAQGPLSLTATVETSGRYVVRVVHSRLCGGCRIEYELQVTHPPGSLRLRPPGTCPNYVVLAGGCVSCPGLTDPVVDLQASPPVARLRVGERALIDVREAGCTFTPPYQIESLSVTDPAVAEIQSTVYGDPAYLAAVRPGRTRVLASVVHIDGSRVQAELGDCSASLSTCTPTRLVLEVVR